MSEVVVSISGMPGPPLALIADDTISLRYQTCIIALVCFILRVETLAGPLCTIISGSTARLHHCALSVPGAEEDAQAPLGE